MPARTSRWAARHKECQAAVDNVKADLMAKREWIETAQRIAEEIDREIEANGSDIDLYWVQEKARDIAWHCRGAFGNPGPRTPGIGHPAID